MALVPRAAVIFTVPPGLDFAQTIVELESRAERSGFLVENLYSDPESRTVSADITLVDLRDAAVFFEWCSARLGQTRGLTGRVTFHICSHGSGETATGRCIALARYEV